MSDNKLEIGINVVANVDDAVKAKDVVEKIKNKTESVNSAQGDVTDAVSKTRNALQATSSLLSGNLLSGVSRLAGTFKSLGPAMIVAGAGIAGWKIGELVTSSWDKFKTMILGEVKPAIATTTDDLNKLNQVKMDGVNAEFKKLIGTLTETLEKIDKVKSRQSAWSNARKDEEIADIEAITPEGSKRDYDVAEVEKRYAVKSASADKDASLAKIKILEKTASELEAKIEAIKSEQKYLDDFFKEGKESGMEGRQLAAAARRSNSHRNTTSQPLKELEQSLADTRDKLPEEYTNVNISNMKIGTAEARYKARTNTIQSRDAKEAKQASEKKAKEEAQAKYDTDRQALEDQATAIKEKADKEDAILEERLADEKLDVESAEASANTSDPKNFKGGRRSDRKKAASRHKEDEVNLEKEKADVAAIEAAKKKKAFLEKENLALIQKQIEDLERAKKTAGAYIR